MSRYAHCWFHLRRHRWGEWFVLQAPTRYRLARTCRYCRWGHQLGAGGEGQFRSHD